MKVQAKVTGPFPVNGKTKGQKVTLDTGETNVDALVAAGLVRLDRVRLVGEAGPELVNLPRGTRVTPKQEDQ